MEVELRMGVMVGMKIRWLSGGPKHAKAYSTRVAHISMWK